MATFANWLAGSETGPQDDPVAWLARQWKALEGNRPRVSSPSGIEKHLVTLAPPGNAAEGDQWTGYVHTAVAEATKRYRTDKAREQLDEPAAGETVTTLSEPIAPSGSPAGAGEVQEPMPGMNAATGKPVAVVPSSAWTQHPDASQYGSCQCGWPRGLAVIDSSGKTVITCAAGHVFTPERPDPLGEQVPDAAALASQTNAPREQVAGALGPYPGADENEPESQFDGTQLDRIELMLLALCTALGLPTDAPGLDSLLQSGITPDPDTTDGLLMSQLSDAGAVGYGHPALQPTQMIPVGTEHAGLHNHAGDGSVEGCPGCFPGVPPSFQAWYGMADPAADATDG